MRGRSEISTGSLDMLLDTLCNTFGGVCFIALMIAILSAMLPNGSAERADAEPVVTEQMLVNQERERLLRRRDELKSAISSFLTANARDENLSTEELDRRLLSNKTAIVQLEVERTKLEKVLSSAESSKQEVERLARLKEGMEKEVKECAGKLRKVRTPIERELPGLQNVTLWLHDGMLYQIDDERQVRISEGERMWSCSIIHGSGHRVDAEFLKGNTWQDIKDCGRTRGYVRIYSDAKSFPQLCMMRDDLVASREMYNWHLHEGTEIIFVSKYDGKVQQ